MLDVQERLARVAGAYIPILITGESGTGKEVIARIVHQLSPWSGGPFVKVNCPAIPGTLIESELFGYERGAFTGAFGTKQGRVEQASRGTLFLDEIGELNLDLQAKLLQLLQDGQFCRIGANEEKRLEARVVCATNRSLETEIAEGGFRQDLYYRINVVNIKLPSLRERRDDIPDLVRYFQEVYSLQFKRSVPEVPKSALEKMEAYPWPGNIRELENVMKRYVILGTMDALVSELSQNGHSTHVDLDPMIPSAGPVDLKETTREAVRRIERNVMLSVLERHRWNRKKAAKTLNISYRALLYKIKEAGLRVENEAEAN
jgi:two-component system, NtrC family, response regulator AtoC